MQKGSHPVNRTRASQSLYHLITAYSVFNNTHAAHHFISLWLTDHQKTFIHVPTNAGKCVSTYSARVYTSQGKTFPSALLMHWYTSEHFSPQLRSDFRQSHTHTGSHPGHTGTIAPAICRPPCARSITDQPMRGNFLYTLPTYIIRLTRTPASCDRTSDRKHAPCTSYQLSVIF